MINAWCSGWFFVFVFACLVLLLLLLMFNLTGARVIWEEEPHLRKMSPSD